MRYHRDDPTKPWPLVERLWEASDGIWMGVLMSVFVLGAIFIAGEVISAVFMLIRGAEATSALFVPGLVFTLKMWKFILILCAYSALNFWMKNLMIVNEDSITSEELIIHRLDRIERSLSAIAEGIKQPSS